MEKYNNILFKDEVFNSKWSKGDSSIRAEALVYLPDGYDESKEKFPLLIFFPGAGEDTNNLADLLKYSPLGFANKGAKFPFIIIGVQTGSHWSMSPESVTYMLPDVVNRYKIDVNRIYMTGLSAGGQTTWNYSAAYQITPPYFPAAIVIMSAATTPSDNDAANVVKQNIHVWGFGDVAGDIHGLHTKQACDLVNKQKAGLAKFTATHNGHGGWQKWYDPAYKENGINIYDWMAQFSRDGKAIPPIEVPPVEVPPVEPVTITKVTIEYSDGTKKVVN